MKFLYITREHSHQVHLLSSYLTFFPRFPSQKTSATEKRHTTSASLCITSRTRQTWFSTLHLDVQHSAEAPITTCSDLSSILSFQFWQQISQKSWLSWKCEATMKRYKCQLCETCAPVPSIYAEAPGVGGASTLPDSQPSHRPGHNPAHAPHRTPALNIAPSSYKKENEKLQWHQPGTQIHQNGTFSLMKTTAAEVRRQSAAPKAPWFLSVWSPFGSLLPSNHKKGRKEVQT